MPHSVTPPAPVLLTPAPMFGALEEELTEIRNRIVEIASRRKVAMADVINREIVFTRDELAAAVVAVAASFADHVAVPSRTAPGDGSRSAGNLSDDIQRRSVCSSRHDVDVVPTRHRPLPPGAQLRPDLPPDADGGWIEDEERRQSIPVDIRREFQSAVVHASASDAQATALGSGRPAPFSSGKRSATWTLGTKRAFGVEMETYLPKRSDEFLLDNAIKAIRDVVPALRTFLGSEFEVGFMDYQHAKDDRAYQTWKITTDLSIKSEDGRPIFGLEFITPKLSGPLDLWKVEYFCDQLQSLNFNTNTSTALHVHVSAEDLTNQQLVRLCQYQVVFEHVFDTFMTLPRRADYSRYCRSNLKSISPARSVAEALQVLAKLNVDKTCAPLIRAFCPRLSAVRNSHRNHKVNLLLLNRTRVGTPGRRVEFRQHQGSIDKVEVSAWVVLVTKWVETVSRMPPPSADEGTVERFWQIVNEPKLRTYYTVKAQTLPSSMTFTYDSRELYAYESDEEEKSDIDDSTPPDDPLITPAAHGGGAATAAVPQLPNAARSAQPQAAPTQPSTVPRSGGAPALTPTPPVQPQQVPTFSRANDAFSSDSETGEGEETIAEGLVAQIRETASSPAPAPVKPDKMFTAPSDTLRVDTMEKEDVLSRSSLSHNEAPINVAKQQMRRTRSVVSIGNFVLPLPIRVECLTIVQDGESWKQVQSDDTDVIVTDVPDTNDNTAWFITPPSAKLLQLANLRHTDGSVRIASPWILEAKKLEILAVCVDNIKATLLAEDTLKAVVSVNVSSLTNAEVVQVIAGVLTMEAALHETLGHGALQAASREIDTKSFAKVVSEMIKVVQAQSNSTPFAKQVLTVAQQLLRTDCFDGKDVIETAPSTRGNFSLRRALHFSVHVSSVTDLIYRCIFLSYACHHLAKRMKDTDIIRQAESSRTLSPAEVIDLITTLPSSVKRALR